MTIIYKSLNEIFKKKKYCKIPFSDIKAYIMYPNYNHFYNKLYIAETQYLPAGPMGVYPKEYPVIFKPRINKTS